MTQGARRLFPLLPRDPAPGGEPLSRPAAARFHCADGWYVLAWTLLIGVWFWDIVLCKSALFYFDITEINLPYRKFLADEYTVGRFSRWHPGLYCGFPLFSESQAGYLHPSKLIYLIPGLPVWAAFGLDTVGSVWLAGLAAYLWLRVRAGPAGAFAGAAVYALGGYTWAHFVHTSMLNAIVSVPLVLWGFEGMLGRSKGRIAYLGVAAVALACQVFAGHLQDAAQTGLLLGLYAGWQAVIARRGAERLTAVFAAAAIVVLGAGLSAVQWVSSLELIGRSVRAQGLSFDELTYGSWHPELLPTLILPETFGSRAFGTDWLDGVYPYHEMSVHFGMVALLLALVGLTRCRERWVSFWPVLAVLAVVFMLGRFTLVHDLIAEVPVLKSMRIPARYGQWLLVAVAALAATGIERLRDPTPVPWRQVILAWLGFLLVAALVGWRVYAPAIASPPRDGAWQILLRRELVPGVLRLALFVLLTLGTLVLIRRLRQGTPHAALAQACLLVWLILDLFLPHALEVPRVAPTYWDNPPPVGSLLADDRAAGTEQAGSDRLFSYPDQSSAPRGYAVQPIDFLAIRGWFRWSLAPVWGRASTGGVSPLVTQRMVAYTDSAVPGRGRFEIESVKTLIFQRFHEELRPLYDNPLWGNVPVPRIKLLPGILKNAQPLPRARILGRPRYATSAADAANLLHATTRDTRDQIVVEDPARPVPNDAPLPRGDARIVREIPERIEIETRLDQPGYLFLADSWDPGWSVTVNGQPRPIVPAYVAFRAVFLPAGSHSVVFTYQPVGFREGLILSLGSLFLFFAACLVRRSLPQLPVIPWEQADSRLPIRVVLVCMMGLVLIMVSAFVPIPGHGGPVSARWTGSWHQLR